VSGIGRPVGPGFKDRRVTATQHRRSEPKRPGSAWSAARLVKTQA
jgi:hypothetical protein